MAAPNIVAVANILGKSTFVSLTTTNATTLLSNASDSNKVFKVNNVVVANTDGTNAVNFTLNYNTAAAGAGTNVEMVSTVSVPANASLIAMDKSTSIYLEENTSLTVQAGTASKLKVTVSYEDIS
jgi:hypothetical protein